MKAIDLYSTILDGFVDILDLHGITEMKIPNSLTMAVAEKCIKQLQNTSSKSNYTCRDCGMTINEGEEKTFGVCDLCYEKHYSKLKTTEV